MSLPTRAADVDLIGCRICGLICEKTGAARSHCPRCDSALCQRKENSVARAWALWTAGLILYVPANVLPVMYTYQLGEGDEGTTNTIMSGVIDFWNNGSFSN